CGIGPIARDHVAIRGALAQRIAVLEAGERRRGRDQRAEQGVSERHHRPTRKATTYRARRPSLVSLSWEEASEPSRCARRIAVTKRRALSDASPPAAARPTAVARGLHDWLRVGARATSPGPRDERNTKGICA